MKAYVGTVILSGAIALMASCAGGGLGTHLASVEFTSIRMVPPPSGGGVDVETIEAGGEETLHSQGLPHGDVVEQTPEPEGWVIRWQGFVGDYAVFDGGLRLHFAPDGALTSLEQESVTTLPVPTHLLSAASARLAAESVIASEPTAAAADIALRARLTWWATSFSRPHELVWIVSYASTGTTPGGAIVLDAETGAILQSSFAM